MLNYEILYTNFEYYFNKVYKNYFTSPEKILILSTNDFKNLKQTELIR